MKDPVEVGIPSSNCPLIVLRVNKSRDCVTFALFDDLLLYFRDSPVIKCTVGERARNVHHWFNSRRQLIYRVAHGLVEVVQFLSTHSPFKSSTDIGTGQSEFDVIHFVSHRVLVMCEPGTSRRGSKNLPESLREGR